MRRTMLGNTGLEVGVAGLGCGGSSRLGTATGRSGAESIALVRRAIDLGVTLLDTAEAYGTEEIVGRAAAEAGRDGVVISTKSRIRREGRLLSAEDIVANLEASLRRLATDRVEVFHFHGIPPADYDHVRDNLVPALLREKEKGKLRHLGITETGPNDPRHEMLLAGLDDGIWEVVMLAFHMMNQNARHSVFPLTLEKGVGTLLMFVVRRIFSEADYLREIFAGLAAEGRIPADLAAAAEPLGFLVHEAGADDVIDAAYRYAAHTAGADVVLFGTGSVAHLERNIDSILKPALPAGDVARLEELFGALEGVGLDLPPLTRNPSASPPAGPTAGPGWDRGAVGRGC